MKKIIITVISLFVLVLVLVILQIDSNKNSPNNSILDMDATDSDHYNNGEEFKLGKFALTIDRIEEQQNSNQNSNEKKWKVIGKLNSEVLSEINERYDLWFGLDDRLLKIGSQQIIGDNMFVIQTSEGNQSFNQLLIVEKSSYKIVITINLK
jgi:hypothetical protein